MSQLKRAVDLVGRYVVEPLSFIFFRKGIPVFLSSLQKRESTHHVGAGKGKGILDRAVYMAFSCEMYDAVDLVLPYDTAHIVKVRDIGLDEGIVGLVFYVLEIGEIAGISKFVEIHDMVIGIFGDKQPDYMRPDETGAASSKYILHINKTYIIFIIHYSNTKDQRQPSATPAGSIPLTS